MMRLIIRPAAELDIQEAADWYEEEEPGLGARFIDELQTALTRLRTMPLQFPNVGRSVRRTLLHRFPYAVYFLVRDDDHAVVLAVLHQRRDPATWKQRLPGKR